MRWTGLVVVAALVVGGCSDPAPVLLPETVEGAVSDSLGDLRVVDLSCPAVADFAELPEGDTTAFECGATLGDEVIYLAVSLTRQPDDVLSASVAVVTPLLDMAAVEATAAAQLDAELGGRPEVACAEAYVVIAVGREIWCRVTADGGTAGPVDRVIVVRIVDADGGWEIDLVP